MLVFRDKDGMRFITHPVHPHLRVDIAQRRVGRPALDLPEPLVVVETQPVQRGCQDLVGEAVNIFIRNNDVPSFQQLMVKHEDDVWCGTTEDLSACHNRLPHQRVEGSLIDLEAVRELLLGRMV